MATDPDANVKTNQNSKNFRLDQLLTQNIDLKGRRVVNAGASKDPGDYITRAEFDALKKKLGVT